MSFWSQPGKFHFYDPRHKILQLVPTSLVFLALFLNHSTLLETQLQILILFGVCGILQLILQLGQLCGLSFFYLHYAFSFFTLLSGFLSLFFASVEQQSTLQYKIINQLQFKLSELVLCAVFLYITYLLVFPCLFCTGCIIFKGEYELASQRLGSIALFTYICTSVTFLVKNINTSLNLDISILLLCLLSVLTLALFLKSEAISQHILSTFSTAYDSNLVRQHKFFIFAIIGLLPFGFALSVVKLALIDYDMDQFFSGFFLNCYLQSPTLGISYFLVMTMVPILLSLGTMISKVRDQTKIQKIVRHSKCFRHKIYDPLEVMRVPLLNTECCYEEVSETVASQVCGICGKQFNEDDMVIVHKGQEMKGCMRAFHASEVGQLLDQGKRGCPHCSRNFF